ncbi:MAG: protein of unknown function (DUF748) [Candidatus Electronema aureum]|uniref:Uncharacterized protein n=1 Tax=Candidatus Electronema aureum TaxID=2005002 RepID=A0A521G220_9BACT|nr:MAG: protein of unknown function (DUF748) [Candidatus Electronema aureum]
MTDEQKPFEPTKKPDFGEIQISPGGGSAPRTRSPQSPNQKATAVAHKPPEKAAQRKKTSRSGGRHWGHLCLILLLAVPLLFLLCLAGGLYLLPRYIKGSLAEELGRQLGRPVTIGQASLSPLHLDLHLGEITIGAATAHPEEQEIARIADLDARIRPAGLLHGQVILDDVRIDRLRANLLRRTDGSFNVLPPQGSLLNALPNWLQIHGLRLHRSTVHFFDQPSDKKHLVEHIEFTLPAAGQGAEPSLSAVVNSSPLQITGQRQQDGSPETRLSLKLDDLDPQQYIGLVPGMADKLSLSAQRADAVLEIILQDADKGLAVTGAINFSALLAQSANCEEQPEQCVRLAAPVAHLIVKVHPLQKLCTVEELLLEEPQLDLPESQEALLSGGPLAAKAAALFNPEEIGLAIGKLNLNKGRIRSGKKEWADVQIDLSGFQNAKAASLVEKANESLLSLSAVSGASVFDFKGSVDSAFNLSGSLSLQNMQADLLRPYLSAEESLRFAKGTADLAGEVRLEQAAGKANVTFSGSTVALRDFTLQRGDKKATALLTGKILRGTDCSLDSSGVVCDKVMLEQANFADSGLLLPSGGAKNGVPRFAANTLELKNSSARLPLGAAQLPLSGLNLVVQADKSFKLTAAAGKKGSIAITGEAAKGKDGAALLTGDIALKNISAALLDGYLAKDGEIRFSQGTADISGAFRLEQGRLNLSSGAVSVQDFAVQRQGAALLAGKTLSGNDCALNGSDRSMSCGKVTLEQADFADSGFFLQPAGRLRFAADTLELKNSAARLMLGTTQLPLSGLNLSLSGLRDKQPSQNNFKLEATAGGSGRIEISGAAAKSDAGLTMSGSVALREVTASVLDPYLSESGDIRFSQGTAEINGTGSLTGAVLHLSSGTVSVQDFVLQRGSAALLSGKALSGADCALDGGSHRMSCASVLLDQANFTDSGFFLRPAGQLRFSADSVDIKNSTALLQLAGSEVLALSGLNMNLSGLPGQINLEAAAGSGRLELSGEASKSDAGLSLSGKLALKNIDVALLNPYLGDELRLSKGSADISGSGSLTSTEGGATLHLDSGAVALHDFSLQRDGASLLFGKSLNGADCSLDGGSHSMSCGSVALAQADFAEAAPAFFFQAGDKLRFTANTVEISDSTARLPLGSGANRPLLPLSGLKMSLSGLREAQPGQNFQLEAAAGQGSFKAEGSLRKDGSGSAAVTGEQLDIRLFSKAFAGLFRDGLAPDLKQGSLSFQGQFVLPESRFTGDFQISNLAAETSRGDSLRWQRAEASNTAVALSPFAAAAEKIALHEPSLRIASAEESLPVGFFALFQALPQLAINQCNVSGGSLERSGSSFSNIEGSFAPVKAGAAAVFSLTGKMNGGDFTVSGSSGSEQAHIDKLAVERLPLIEAGKELARQLALDESRGKVTRTVSAAGDRLDFSGFVPQPTSDFAFTLALLTDTNGSFSMPLQSVPFAAPDEVVVKAAADMLQKLRLQSVTTPWTVLDKLVPNLTKAQKIEFLAGDKVPDFMDGLDGIRALTQIRPHLGWTIKGCYNQEDDQKPLLAQLHKAGEKELEVENLRRKAELDKLIVQEEKRQQTLNKMGLPIIKDMLPEIKQREDLQPLAAKQDELPENVLPELARARAEVVRNQLTSKLNIPAERVKIEESAACGTRVELLPVPVW